MKNMPRPFMPVLLASVITVAVLFGWGHALADPIPLEKTVIAAVLGAVSGKGGSAETVVFSGQASISGKVIHDTDFGAPPILEIVVDLSQVSGKGLRSGKTYVVSSQVIVHRPLQSFEPVEFSFPFFADGDMLSARSAVASFGLSFNAVRGITASRVFITPNLPG